ncbi:acyl-CoA Delta-9 desaturase-like [Bacillus rossius redtenbacheri]|uniref:acyl-CoA Delta-9 desaturase-like n=1 Tax=Bacillus rossius redtenbacheri TaxID=93214 RepID=UPI002FDCDBA3
MAPNVTSSPSDVLYKEAAEAAAAPVAVLPPRAEAKPRAPYRRQIVWRNVLLFAALHLAALYGAYLLLTSAKLLTILFAVLMYQMTGLGITAGAHRLWAHRSYKAKWPLKLILMIFNSMAFQNDVIEWARDHRVHHKFSETDADPHNATRGFFFSHVGWLLVRKHPDVKEKGKGIDMSDLERDPILAFQKKYYLVLMPLCCFVLPTLLPMYGWGESFRNTWFVVVMFRYSWTLNMTWLVNSAAHMWGSKPYDVNINPAENLSVALGALGEGWHNYHHVFPWDYRAAELGNYRANLTTAFIDLFSRVGWAYDLKTVPETMVKGRVERTGDGSHALWGWGDRDMTQEDKDCARVVDPKSR